MKNRFPLCVLLITVLGLCAVVAVCQTPQPAPSAVTIPSTAAGNLLSGWLSAFNSGDEAAIRKFNAEHFSSGQDPDRRAQRDMQFRKQTGGFDLETIEDVSEKEIVGIVKEKGSDRRGRLRLAVSDGDNNKIGKFGVELVSGATTENDHPQPPPAKVPTAQLTRDVDSQLTKLTADDQFAGTVLVAKDGKVLWEKAYGLADRDAKTPNTVNTRFRLGSMNKMFTSVAIAQLVQQGRLKFSDTIAQVLPDYPNKEAAAKVTIDQLLTHTSGVSDFFGQEFDQKRDSLRTLADYLPLFANKPLEFEPGKGWAYSNSGFLVLGLILEKISGETYYDYVQKHVYDVAGMKNSGTFSLADKVSDLAGGYTRDSDSEPWRPNTDTLPWRGSSAGGGHSTVEDLLKFDQALRQNRLLNAEMTRLVTTGKVHPPQFPEGAMYGYGFGEKKIDGKRVVGHNGGAPGMNAELDMHLDSGYTVVVLANRDPDAAVKWTRYISERLE